MSRLMYYDEEAHQFFPMPDDQPEPMRSTTNGDRIRAMTDEELAYFMANIEPCRESAWLDWLREEAEQ